MHELQERLLSQSQTITALQAQIESQQSAIQDHIVYQAKLEEQITAYRHRLDEAQAEKRALEQRVRALPSGQTLAIELTSVHASGRCVLEGLRSISWRRTTPTLCSKRRTPCARPAPS